VPCENVGRRLATQFPGHGQGSRRSNPAVVIDGAVAQHFEILSIAFRRREGVGLVPRIGHAHALDRLLLDAVDRVRSRNPGGFQDRWGNVDYVVELRADAASVLDARRPRYTQSLARTPEMRSDLLDPLERGVEGPGPSDGHVRVGLVGTPERVEQQLVFDRDRDAIERGDLVGSSEQRPLRARAVVAADVDDQGVVELAYVFDRLN